MNVPPQAPMPPPIHQQMPPGAIPINDWNQPQVVEVAPDDGPQMFEYYPEQQETKSKKDKKAKVETMFEGYMLEKADPLPGERSSWQRVGKRMLPFDDEKLVRLVKDHRKRAGSGPAADFLGLTGNQQGIINRLIAERKREDKNANADWIMVDVQKFGAWGWTTLDIKKIQVVLKRIDKNDVKAKEKAKEKAKNNASGYQYGEIIDLADPLPGKKDKKNKKNQDDEQFQYIDEPVGLGFPMDGGYGPGPQPYDNFNQQQQQQYGPPPGAIPIPVDQYHQGGRQPFHGHPFQPNHDQITPGLMNQHDQQQYPQDYQPGDQQMVRRHSTRRTSNTRRMGRLEDRMDDRMDELERQIADLQMSSDSSDGHHDQESLWSHPLTGGSFTPPSTPPMSPQPKGSLSRRRSRAQQDDGQYGRRSRSRPRYYNEDRYRDRGQGQRSQYRNDGYDDYPRGRGDGQRYHQAAPRQRRLTDGGQRQDDYPPADFNRQERRRSTVFNEPVYQEAYGGRRQGRRESGRYYQ